MYGIQGSETSASACLQAARNPSPAFGTKESPCEINVHRGFLYRFPGGLPIRIPITDHEKVYECTPRRFSFILSQIMMTGTITTKISRNAMMFSHVILSTYNGLPETKWGRPITSRIT